MKEGTPFALLGINDVWSSEHMRPSKLLAMRGIGDPLADAVAVLLDDPAVAAQVAGGSGSGCPVTGAWTAVDKLALLAARGDAAAQALWRDLAQPPAWLSWERLARGQNFYREYTVAGGVALLNASLIGGFGSRKINAVLTATGYMTAHRDAVHRRLAETAQLVVDVTEPGQLRPPPAEVPSSPAAARAAAAGAGAAWRSAANVRLLHAAVRVRLLRRTKNPWDVAEYGVPINQMDMLVTQNVRILNAY